MSQLYVSRFAFEAQKLLLLAFVRVGALSMVSIACRIRLGAWSGFASQ